MSASVHIPANPPSSHLAIQNLIVTYAELVASGRYRDRFECCDGQWRFAERRVLVDLAGDVSRHLRHPM